MALNSFFCTKPWTSFRIHDYKGNINPCCWSKINCGNVNRATIEEIWNGPGFVHVRSQMAKGNLTSICADDCPYWLGEFSEKKELLEAKTPPCRENWLLQREELEARKLVLESKPTLMRIVPSVACNLSCVMCYQDHHDSVELPGDIAQTIIRYFPVLQELLVLGGEPLVSRECLQVIASMDPNRYPDLHLALITNGTTVTNKVEKLLHSRRISWILVSIDAASPETYEKIRGGKFERVISGVEKLKKIRDAQGLYWRLLIGFTLMRSNLHEATDFVDLAEDLNVDFVFTPIFGDWHGEHFHSTPLKLGYLEENILALEDYLVCKGKDKIKAARLRFMLESLIDKSFKS